MKIICSISWLSPAESKAMLSNAHAAHSYPLFPYSSRGRRHAAADSVELRRRRITSSQASEEASEVAHEGPPAGSSLRGADVLRALQRAVAAKETALREKRRRKKKRSPTPAVEGGGMEFEDVQPIEIRGYWATRIEELEKRIQELQEWYYD